MADGTNMIAAAVAITIIAIGMDIRTKTKGPLRRAFFHLIRKGTASMLDP